MELNILLTTLDTLAKNMANYIPQAEKVEQACSGEAKKEITALRESLIEDTKLVQGMLKQAESIKHDSNEIKKMQERMDRITDDYEYAQKTITRLEGEIFRLDDKIESHESKISTLQEEVQATKTEMRKMRDDLRDEMNQMRNKARKTEDELSSQIKKVKNEARKIKDEMRVMKNIYSTEQIALSFEQDLAKYVYPDEKENGANQIFTRMKEWLKEKEKTPQGKEANEKWKALQEKVSWSTIHEDVLKKLRDSRKRLAHPSLDLETAQSHIPDDLFNAEEKKYIEDIIDIIKEVNDRMEEAEQQYTSNQNGYRPK